MIATRNSLKRPAENRKRRLAPSVAGPFLIATAAGLICYGLFFRRGLGLSVIGYSIAPAERVMQGEVPYRDFLFNYTPGILWVNALLMKAFGAGLMTIRIGLFAFKLLTLMALFHVARRLTCGWAALVPVALTLAWLGYGQVFNVYPDQYLILFALAGLVFMLRYNESGKNNWLALCGVAVALVFLFKYNVGVLLFAAGALAIVTRTGMASDAFPVNSRRVTDAAKAGAVYLAGFAIVGGALLAYLTYNHAFGPMLDHFMHHAAQYSEERSIGLPSPSLVVPVAVLLLPAIGVGFLVVIVAGRGFQFYMTATIVAGSVLLIHWTRGKVFNTGVVALVAYFPPLIFGAAAALAIWQLKKSEGGAAGWWNRNGAITITGLFALALYLEVFPRADFYHLVRILPPVFMFFFALLVRWLPALTEQLRETVPSPRRAALLVVSAPLIFLVAAGEKNCWEPEFDSRFHFRASQELAIDRGRGILVEERQAQLAEGLVRLIQDNSSPDDPIFSFAQRGSALYFLAARQNPSRLLWWSSVGIKDEDRQAVMAMVDARLPKLIVIQDIPANKEIQDHISAYYNHIGTVIDIAVYNRID